MGIYGSGNAVSFAGKIDMKLELSQSFYFEASHTLNRCVKGGISRTVHGHTYHARVTIKGPPDDTTGMVLDLDELREVIEPIRMALDHKDLDRVHGLDNPTLEGLCQFIMARLDAAMAGDVAVHCVSVRRKASGDKCTLKAKDWVYE